MAGFCHWWNLPPSEFWRLSLREAGAMFEVMERVNKERRKQAEKQKRAARARAATARRRR